MVEHHDFAQLYNNNAYVALWHAGLGGADDQCVVLRDTHRQSDGPAPSTIVYNNMKSEVSELGSEIELMVRRFVSIQCVPVHWLEGRMVCRLRFANYSYLASCVYVCFMDTITPYTHILPHTRLSVCSRTRITSYI